MATAKRNVGREILDGLQELKMMAINQLRFGSAKPRVAQLRLLTAGIAVGA
jgi:hypothetical protein